MLRLESPSSVSRSKGAAELDRNLQEAARSKLRESGYGPVARVECRVHAGIVELTGIVPSFHMKQVAQAVIQRLDRVKDIRNEVQVI